MRRRRRLAKKDKGSEEMSLQITSMADIFTIILVFLLKGVSAGAVGVPPASGVSLPTANQGQSLVETVRLEVSETSVLLDGRPIQQLRGFEFDPNAVKADGTSDAIAQAFGGIRQKHSANGIDPAAYGITVLADQKVPYSTLKTIFASGAMHGYTQLKLVVMDDQK